jgi:hypothetical protein
MRDVFDDLIIDVFRELHSPLSSARGTRPTAFAGEGVLAAVAV